MKNKQEDIPLAKVLTFTAKSVDEALANASAELGIPAEELRYEVTCEAKKGLFGLGSQDAQIRVSVEENPDELALEFVRTILKNFDLSDETLKMEEIDSKEVKITVEGDDMGLIIGHHGEILESIQYLTNLAANKGRDGYRRYTVDIENYRSRREEALRRLAQKTAARAKRQGRNVTLEPMSANERRIIHSEVQNIDGVTTFSIGSGDQRKVVVSPENKKERQPKRNNADKPRQASPAKSNLPSDIPTTYAGGGVSKQPVVKAKSIEELGLADPDDSDIY